MTVELDVSSAQPVQTAAPSTAPELDMSTAQAVTEPKPVALDLSTAQPIQPSGQSQPTTQTQPQNSSHDWKTNLGLSLWEVYGPEMQDLARKTGKVLNVIGLGPDQKPIVADLSGAKPVIKAEDDTTWHKVTAFATHPIASLLSSPEMALPVVAGKFISKELSDSGHPTAAKAADVYTGSQKSVADTALGMSSPLNLGIVAATGGLGAMEGVAGPVVARLVNLGFSVQGLYQAYRNVPEIRKAMQEGDIETVAKLMTSTAGNLAMSGMAGLHALGEVNPSAGKSGKANAELLRNAPVVKIVDSDAAKVEAESQTTVPVTAIKPTQPEPTHVYNPETKAIEPVETKPAETKSVDVTEAKPTEANSEQTGKPTNNVEFPTKEEILPTAKVVTDDHIPVVSKDEILAEATQRIINNSPVLRDIVDPEKIQTPADITKALNNASEHIENNIDPRVGVRISLDAQKQLANDLGMTPEDLMGRRFGEAFNAESAIAARMMLRASADNVLKQARLASTFPADEQAQVDLGVALAKHQEIANQVAGVTAEAGRALGSFRVDAEPTTKVNTKIADLLTGLDPKARAEATKLLAKIDPTDPNYVRKATALIREITPSSTADKIFEWYRNSLLSSPSTVIKKVISETAMMALDATKKTIVGGLEKAKAATGVSKSPEAFASEGYWYAKGAAQALAHSKAILSGEFNLADAPGFEHGGQSAIKGKLGQVVRIPSEVIGRQTNLVYAMNYFGELNSLAARQAISEGLSGEELSARQEYLAQNPTKEMTKAADEIGKHNTFQNELGKTGKSVQAAIQSNPIAKFLFPFFRTPVNLVKASGEYSPYGLLKGTAKGDLNLQTKGLLGSSIAAGIAYLAAQGIITGGGPVDFKQRQTKEATGWQPYSVKIGGKYYSFHKGEPLGLTLGFVADAVHSFTKDEDPAISNSKAANALNHITRNVSDLPFLMQLGNIVESLTHLGQGNTAERIIDNLLASAVVPAGVKAVAQTIDPTVRSPIREGTADPTKGLSQTIQERLPGLTHNVPADIDVTGKPVQRPASALGGANPFPVSTEKNNPVVAELARLGVTVENAPAKIVVRGAKGRTLNIPGGDMTPEEALKLRQQEVEDFYQRASVAINQPNWAQIPDPAKMQWLKKLHAGIVKDRLQRLQQIRSYEPLQVVQ